MRGDVLLLVVRSLRYRRHFSGGARDGEGTPKILLAFVGAEVVRKLYGYLMDMGAWRNASCQLPVAINRIAAYSYGWGLIGRSRGINARDLETHPSSSGACGER